MSDKSNITPEQKKQIKEAIAFLIATILASVIVCGTYRFLLERAYFEIVLMAYIIIETVAIAAYLIYNRGFSRMNVTPEMLPASMSAEEKNEFIENGKQRLEKSKWMLLIIFPLIMTFLLDTVGMYLIEPLLDFTSSIS